MIRADLGDLHLGTTELDTGVRWALPPGAGIVGWGSPASTASPRQRARGHGAWVGEVFMAERNVVLSGTCSAPTAAALSDASDRLIAAAALTSTRLTVHEGDRSRWCMVQRRGEVAWDWVTQTFARWSVSLVAADPRKFGDPITKWTNLPSTTGGASYPRSYPMSYDAVTVTGQVSIANPGNMPGPVVARIDAPVTAPVITHTSSGRALVFASSLSLGLGEFVVIDMTDRTVLAQGQESRNGWVTRRGWSLLEPGENTWAFTAGLYTPGAQMTITGTPAWG